MTITITTHKGRTAQTTRYQGLSNAMRAWAVPFARGEGFTLTLETQFVTRKNQYTCMGELVRAF